MNVTTTRTTTRPTDERTCPPAVASRWGGPWGLVASLAVVSVVALIGRQWTDTGAGSWYAGLEQPVWNPPDWLFGPVWSVLYVMMAVAAWIVVRVDAGGDGYVLPDRSGVRLALWLYAAQLALNLGWTGLFFGLERPGWALVDNLVLLAAIAATASVFARTSRVAAALLVPYALWVTYATALTAAIVVLN